MTKWYLNLPEGKDNRKGHQPTKRIYEVHTAPSNMEEGEL
jgi:hypothetical protein